MKKLISSFLFSLIYFNVFSQNPQPEYTSYEDAGATDMVSLLTGDFTYTLPILNVPGSDGDFTIPISYHSGIKNSELASWVGLGWSLNCGAITRQVSHYPDDFSGQTIKNKLYHQGGKDYSKTWIVYTEYTYNNGKNKGGSIGLGNILSYSWGKSRDLKLIGVNYDFEDNNLKKTKAEDVALAVVEVASYMVDYGLISSTSQAGSAIGVASQMSGLYSNAQTAAMIASMFTDYSSSSGLWQSKIRYKWLNDWCLLKTENKYYLNTGVDEKAYGVLNLSKMPCNLDDKHYSAGYYKQNESTPLFYENRDILDYPYDVTSDYQMYIDDDTEYQWSMNPTSLTPDNYIVMGTGVSGSIEPYRFEATNIVPNSFGDEYNHKKGFNNILSYKLPFTYKGANSNYYNYQIGEDQTLPLEDINLESQFGVEIKTDCQDEILKYIVKDSRLINNMSRIEDSRKGLNVSTAKEYRFVSGNYVEWYTNLEIKEGRAFNGNFLDFTTESDVFRTECAKQNEGPSTGVTYHWEGIGGFSITRNDGLTYHYAIPVYNIQDYNFTETKINNFDTPIESEATNNNKYAIHWLLTAITGPDFIDRNSNHIADEEDWGYWVKFEYSKYADYCVRTPSAGHFYSLDGKVKSYAISFRETYYLSNIQTRTHVAYFVKSPREDGYDYGYGSSRRDNRTSLKLDDIYLLKRDDFNALQDKFPSLLSSFETGTANTEISSYLSQIQIRRVNFDYDYSLCKGTHSNINEGGKLTLNAITTFYKNNARIVPPYIFSYSSNNPSYDASKYDFWGMYNSKGAFDRSSKGSGDEWLLTQIKMPVGSVLNVKYQKDSYSSVSGYDVPEKKGGDSRVSQISVNDNLGNTFVTDYIYSKDGTPGGVSSGVCSLEPEGGRSNIGLYTEKRKEIQSYDYPATPIMYGHVVVLSNNSKSKEEYEFVTPHFNMINWRCKQIKDQTIQCGSLDEIKAYNYVIDINTANIGAIKSVKKYYDSNLLSAEAYTYEGEDESGVGVFAESSILFEGILSARGGGNWNTERLFRTTKIYHPSYLTKIETKTSSGVNLKVSNNEFDFYTGQVISSEIVKNNSEHYTSEKIPAYTQYAQMGSKVDNLNNKNMLVQEMVSYTKKLVGNEWKYLNASVQTWNNRWTYRRYDADKSQYIDENQTDVWRKHETFAWKGEINADGTYKNFEDKKLAYRGIGWIRTSEITRYNHYSMPLEAQDINGNFSATKMDISNNYSISSGAGVRYDGFAYTGFEKVLGNQWDGEFISASGCEQVHGTATIPAHTGNYYVSVAGEESPVFSSLIPESRDYVASVWMHKNTPKYATLVIEAINGVETQTGIDSRTKEDPRNKIFGDWILVTASLEKIKSGRVQVPTGAHIYTYVKIDGPVAGQPMLLDDHRLQPVNASVSATVYDIIGNVDAVLDNNNIATKFEYNLAGKLIKTYKETSPQGFKKVSENRYNYKRSLFPVGFSVSSSPAYGSPVTFTALNAGTDVASNYKWSFGDGNTAVGKIVTNTYDGYDDEEYTVSLTVNTGDNKTETVTRNILIQDNSSIYISHPYTNQVFQRGEEIVIKWSGYQGTVDISVFHNGETWGIGSGESGGEMSWAPLDDPGTYVITVESSTGSNDKSSHVTFTIE